MHVRMLINARLGVIQCMFECWLICIIHVRILMNAWGVI